MKRAITTLGVLGLAALTAAAPAAADRGGGDDDDKIVICHTGSGSNSGHFSAITVAIPSLNGHDRHGADIIPPNDGMDDGQNWNAAGRDIHAKGCETPGAVVPPADVLPVVVNPPVVPPATIPPDLTAVVVPEQPGAVQPQARAPQTPAAAPSVEAAADISRGTNQGYNAQTAVGGSDGAPSWMAGVGALLAAGAAVAFRRKSRPLPQVD
ncbi:hypothetical protein ACFVYC_08080 [Pseudarthrobacter sp. NPDC058329]|uniref:hypothetical protein n=1 Tax=Pseudarthrobacter sp. NPDC058329 TaxID=3346448 RepID=UPI0036DF3F2A